MSTDKSYSVFFLLGSIWNDFYSQTRRKFCILDTAFHSFWVAIWDVYREIFGLLKINESTGSDKDEEVQRRTAEVCSENLCNTKLCHSSSTRVPAVLWNQGPKKKVAVHSKRLWESQSPLWYNRISSRNPKKTAENEKNPRKRWKTEGDVERQATVFSKEHCASVDTKSYYSLEDSALQH